MKDHHYVKYERRGAPQWFTALLIKPIPVKFILTADQSETEKDMFAGKKERGKYESAVFHGLSSKIDIEFMRCRSEVSLLKVPTSD